MSPVFVPLEVPENVPDCVASVQSPSVVRAVLASASSKRESPNTEACESSSLLSRAVWSPVTVDIACVPV